MNSWRMARARSRGASVTLAVMIAIAPLGANDAAVESVTVDRVVAVVDDDPILLSELRRTLALGLVPTASTPEATERAALERLIDQRLRFHAVARSGVIDIGRDRVDAEAERIRARFADPEARLRELGLTNDSLRGLVRRRLELQTYVEERLGARVFISLEEIRAHYTEVLVPELEARQAPVPELGEVREEIRALLREAALAREVDRWTEELRRQADVIDLLDEPQREDPPLRVALP